MLRNEWRTIHCHHIMDIRCDFYLQSEIDGLLVSMRIQPKKSESTFTQHCLQGSKWQGHSRNATAILHYFQIYYPRQQSTRLHVVQGVAWGGASDTGISKVEVARSNSDGKKDD
jgi:hypothetical protein